MKNIFFFLSIMLAFVVSANAQQTQGKVPGTQETSDEVLNKVKKNKAYLVDVRTPEEYNAGHLKYSKNIDYKSADFGTQISRLDKKKPVYLYCRSGNRSSKAADTLKVQGFKVYYNIGGFEDLKAAGLPADQ